MGWYTAYPFLNDRDSADGMDPAFTQYERLDPDTLPAEFSVPISEVRSEIGIFSDTSMDDLVLEQVVTAEEICSRFLGRPVLERGITDYYPRMGKWALSTSGLTGAATVTVTNPPGTTETLAGVTTDATDAPVIVIPADETIAVSDKVRNPVKIAYRAGFIHEDQGWPAVRQAVKMYVNMFFYNRGRQDVQIDTRPMEHMLMPYRAERF